MLSVVYFALRSNDGHWTFENFSEATKGPYQHAFLTSIRLALISAAIGAFFGSIASYVVVKFAGQRLRRVLDSICAVLANSGGVPLAFMFIAAFGANGLAIRWLKTLGWDLYGGRWTLFSFSGLVVVYCFFQIPLMLIIFNGAVAGLRKEWQQASTSLGASNFTYWRRVAAPVLAPAFLGAFFLLFAGGFSAYATARAMTVGTTPLVPLVIGNLVDGNVIAAQEHLGDALAVGMVLVAGVAMLAYAITQRRLAKWRNA